MPLPGEMSKIRMRLEEKGAGRSKLESAHLSELLEVDKRLSREQLNEINRIVVKMTGPDDGKCPCCGR
jgi:hypothetical protein